MDRRDDSKPPLIDRTRAERTRAERGEPGRRLRRSRAEARLPPRYAGAAKLGVGGMGVVYKATDQRLDRPVAIKHLQDAMSMEPKALWRFEHEAKAAAKLNHPAIVQIYDLVREGDDVWIVMELVPGRQLASHLTAGPLDIGAALALGVQIADGLAEAHAHGIVHRDLKAANIMVTPTGQAKILDFGVAKSLLTEEESSFTTASVVVGTPYAMSPEQVRGHAIDARSDIFSLGSLLYQMVTGEAPFRGSSPVESLQRIAEHRPPPAVDLNPRIPAELSSLIATMLEKAPDRRPQEAGEVARALERMAAELC